MKHVAHGSQVLLVFDNASLRTHHVLEYHGGMVELKSFVDAK